MSLSLPSITLLLACMVFLGTSAQAAVVSTVHADDRGVSLEARQALSRARLQAIHAHNSKATSLWTATPNQFLDMTDHERNSFVGYTRASKLRSRSASFLEARSVVQTSSRRLAAQVDHRHLQSALWVQNQGGCGSCWAIAAAGAMEMRLELSHQTATRLSWEQLLNCVPNPNQCGGDGGCSGATAELAFSYVQLHGISSADDYSKGQILPTWKSCSTELPRAAQVNNFVQLPTNRAAPILAALADGPAVAAIAAPGMFEYGSGIFDGCPHDAVINHAVLLAGYGEEGNTKYWLVRNSWGADWGEQGYIRLLRHDDDDAHCGVDTSPLEGTACVGGPAEVTVCGMCGILHDVVYPVGTHLADPASRHQQ